MGRGGGRVDKCYKLSYRGGGGGCGVGGVGRGMVDGSTPNFSFYSLNWESIQF